MVRAIGRWILVPFDVIAALLTLVFWPSHQREKRDDVAVLRAAAGGAWPTFSAVRFVAAVNRTVENGSVIRSDAALHLSRKGWERVGCPLSDGEVGLLATLAEVVKPPAFAGRLFLTPAGLATIDILRARGLVRGYTVTDSGRALLSALS